MRCSSTGSICHSPFSSLATEIFPVLIARRIAVLFRPTAAAAVAMVCMGVLPAVSMSKIRCTHLVKKTYLGAAPRSSAPTVLGRRGASRNPQVRDLQFPSSRSHPPSRFHHDDIRRRRAKAGCYHAVLNAGRSLRGSTKDR